MGSSSQPSHSLAAVGVREAVANPPVDVVELRPQRVAAPPTVARWRRAAPVVIIALAYIIPLLIVSPTYGHPLIDDWNYQLSVRHLMHQHELWVAPWTATTLILQIFWGALFAWPFGVTATALRISTLVASFGGTLACYALFRELEISRNRSLAGALAVWFNPLTISLSYTFMTDVPFMVLLCGAVFLFVRAVRRDSYGAMAGASALTGCAFLVRQQGILIPLAVFIWFLISPPEWLRRHPFKVTAALLGPALLALQEYYFWIWIRGTPATQGDYLDDVFRAGVWGNFTLGVQILLVALFYTGMFLLPFTLAGLRNLPGAWRRSSTTARGVILVSLACLLIWTRWYYMQHGERTFPFVPWGSMIHEDGLGVLDTVGLRTPFGDHWVWATIAVVCALSAAVAALLITGRKREPEAPPRQGKPYPVTTWLIGMIGAITVGQFIGIIPPSVHIRQYITFDRYFLPLVPLALALLLWALRGQSLALPISGLVLAAALVVALLGLQDWLAFKQAQWDTATWLTTTQGVPLRELDAGPQWDGIHFYEDSLAHPYDKVPRQPKDVWWLWLIAPQIDPVYQITSSPQAPDGYVLFAKRHYDSWVRPDKNEWIYVWHRVVVPVTTVRPVTPQGSLFNPVKSTTTSQKTQGATVTPTPISQPVAPAQKGGDQVAGPR